MDVDKEYFSNITTRERAIFEGAISMGALFHQFVGTPVNKDTKEGLEKSMEDSLRLQPACPLHAIIHLSSLLVSVYPQD